jgi:hypothetical protein
LDLVYQYTLLVDGFGMVWSNENNQLEGFKRNSHLICFCSCRRWCRPWDDLGKEGPLQRRICRSSVASRQCHWGCIFIGRKQFSREHQKVLTSWNFGSRGFRIRLVLRLAEVTILSFNSFGLLYYSFIHKALLYLVHCKPYFFCTYASKMRASIILFDLYKEHKDVHKHIIRSLEMHRCIIHWLKIWLRQ